MDENLSPAAALLTDAAKFCSNCGRDCAPFISDCPDCQSTEFDTEPGEKHQAYLARKAEEKAKATEVIDTPEGEKFITAIVAGAEEGPQAEFCGRGKDEQNDSDSDREMLEAIETLSDECDEAEREYETAKAEASELKKAFEAMVERLRKKIREAKSSCEFPLVDMASKSSTSPASNHGYGEDESWKLVTIDEGMPDLPKHIREKLQAAELPTMGDLANYVAKDGGKKRLIDIDGIGQVSSDKIEEAQIAFFERRRTAKPSPSPEETYEMLANEAERTPVHPDEPIIITNPAWMSAGALEAGAESEAVQA